ncbi:hypothetical protein [Alicyclobacillus fastidiosus]|uniref:hypothetical protein n=1 Tax=Alicyclobacillus fastidiosus TaxID=392011 RepID=UPI0023EA0B98|nr:hypothetical protein [Alicyclobacillus fastidiosus]GMA66118.1 hypothetical protein GCM10025859_65600 [Alicyclobacillus fastidiosus]
MQWSEVRRLFPDTFVLLEDMKSHVENGELHVEEVAVIRPLSDGKEAARELRDCKGNKFIYHTSKSDIVMPVRPMPNLRSRMQ